LKGAAKTRSEKPIARSEKPEAVILLFPANQRD